MYGIFDPKDLSEAELQDRIQRARHFIGVQIDMGHNSLVDSLNLTLAVLEEEHEYRVLKQREEYKTEMEENSKRQRRRPTLKDKEEKPKKEKPKSTALNIGHISGVDD